MCCSTVGCQLFASDLLYCTCKFFDITGSLAGARSRKVARQSTKLIAELPCVCGMPFLQGFIWNL